MASRDLCALLLHLQLGMQASRGSQQALLLASTALVMVRQGLSSSRYSYSRGCILLLLAKGVLILLYRVGLVLPALVQGMQQVVPRLCTWACSRPTLRLH
jgi:hypothetical protein